MTEETLYYFDGTGGCDLCDGMTGYHPEEPVSPHPKCTCMSETVVVSGGGTIEYRNFEMQETESEFQQTFDYDSCGRDDADASITLGVDEIDNLSGLRDVAEENGWVEPEPDLDIDVRVPGQTHGQIIVTVIRYKVEMSAEMWLVEPNDKEWLMGTVSGSLEENIEASGVYAGQQCHDPIWI